MKSIMISIQPQWVKKILKGEKTIEIRKTMPKCELPCKVYIYCTLGNSKNKDIGVCLGEEYNYICYEFGKVVAEFTLNEVEDFSKWEYDFGALVRHLDLWAGTKGDYPFLIDYLKGQKKGYAWHIDNLKIYDKPKLLQEFFNPCEGCDKLGTDRCTEEISYCRAKVLQRPPQSWCYCEGVSDDKE
ncbi:MAG: hypothetical protein IJX25_00175 [Clostridia bacterium]|nr:hypothetical protein [Clostridia bacterium]